MDPLALPPTPPARLDPDAIGAAAFAVKLDAATLAAVVAVETGGSGGFLADGRPRILFEAHHFGRLTAGRYDATHPDISRRNWIPGAYLGGAAEYGRLERAYRLDPEAALQACSWGLFQIMGFNHQMIGYPTVQKMVEDARSGEPAQLAQGIAFIRAANLLDELQRRDWAGFARGYNGPGFKANRYDEKLEAAWQRARGTPAPKPAPVIPGQPVLDLGDTGDEVRRVQAILRQREAQLQVDGVFGRATEAAVIRFQRRAGLTADGIVGRATWAALTEAAVAAPIPFAPSP